MTDPAIDKNLVVDELDEKFRAFQALRKRDSVAASHILDTLGAQDDVDRDILLELSSRRPLGHADKFNEAHALAVRALEVLDRNGARGVIVKGWGPLNAVAAFFVQQVAHFIVRSYQSTVAEHMLRLYERREANCAVDDPTQGQLTRARIHMQRVTPGFKRSLLGVPAFLLGGAVLSGAVRFVQNLITSALGSWYTRTAATVALALFIGVASWITLRGAAVARRRISLTTDAPLHALWQTIGRCGNPPKDRSRVIALVAVGLALIPWILLPLGVLLSWLTRDSSALPFLN